MPITSPTPYSQYELVEQLDRIERKLRQILKRMDKIEGRKIAKKRHGGGLAKSSTKKRKQSK